MPDPVQWVSYLPHLSGYAAVCGEHGPVGAVHHRPTGASLEAIGHAAHHHQENRP